MDDRTERQRDEGPKKAVGKYKLTLSLEADFARRFDAYAAYIGEDMSAVVTRALKLEMRGFTVSRRPVSEVDADSPTVRLAGRSDVRDAG